MQRLTNENYVPHLTYVEPPTDTFWYIPLSSNGKYYLVFEIFDLRIQDYRKLLMEFEMPNLFQNK